MDCKPRFNAVFATDNNYLPYLQVALKSLLAHHDNLHIFIISNQQLDSQLLERLQEHCAKRDSKLIFVHIEQDKDLPCTNGYITKATYLRYYLHLLFDYSSSPNWLYLDCDLVVNGRLDAPFYLDEFADYALAAVKDPFVASLPAHPFGGQHYFNAGVLYINAKKWAVSYQQLTHLTDQLRDWLIYGDQDVLNLVFQDTWLALDAAYNMQCDDFIKPSEVRPSHPRILHFTGPQKPLDRSNFVGACSGFVQIFRFYDELSWERLLSYPVGFLSFYTKDW